jgi:16S rRNA (uracil1498-N3)-methyltransferase
MKLHRFIGEYDLSKQEVKIINPETIKQIRAVLRLEIGKKIILSDGKGNEKEVVIISMSKNEILCEVEKTDLSRVTLDKNKHVNLYLAILKKENFELAVQKATECGVLKIIPIITERTIKTGINIERLEKIIIEASEQSGRNIVPTLSPILKFKDALNDAKNSEEKVIFHFVENNYAPNKKATEASIFVGPEGGFTEKEIKLAKDADFAVSSLGPLTLRGETAAIVATYLTVYNADVGRQDS